MSDVASHADDIDRLFSTARHWLADGHAVVIATVVETWGSAPRRRGSHLIVRDDGLFEGSVSGGCVEGEVITEAGDLHAAPGFKLLAYGVADTTAWQAGLACGGRISILLQTIGDDWFPAVLVGDILRTRRAGAKLALQTDLASGKTIVAADTPGGAFQNIYDPPLRLAIIGAVHITQFLVPLARMMGHNPLVIDPRSMFADTARFADIPIDTRWPDEALDDWAPNASCAVVALTHDPKLDDVALARALKSDCYYIAALGSRRSQASRLERLAQLGFAPDALARINGPAGLDIGAAGPAEIALSIVAQMTAFWRGKIPVMPR